MNRPHFSFLPLILTAFFLCLVTELAATQEVGLVTVDVKDVAKGYRANSYDFRLIDSMLKGIHTGLRSR